MKLLRVTTAVNRRCCHKSTLTKDITHAARIDIEHELPSDRQNIKKKKYCEEINQNRKVNWEKEEITRECTSIHLAGKMVLALMVVSRKPKTK